LILFIQEDYFRQFYYMRFHKHTDQDSIASVGMAQLLSYECVYVLVL
jgi:hypothetical protein